eukprot:TRINITY_DN3736_c1_g1_i1.p1 TRINITY_DN3736_c1_g1~~TRINITY_DN3736_c1_g1_i1.p1  ORF type:complete len:372 (+),score=62.40 TRINITY_DN3736_c1_g1_i1:80-1195(+)
MAAALTVRRRVLTSAGIGVAAGCMGTWFEMSHGIFCIPTVSMPPLQLSHQVAVGSTVFGVAARQLLSSALYSLDPSTPDLRLDDEALEQLIDVSIAGPLAISGTVSALWGAALSKSVSQRTLRRGNGVFLCGVALFLNWREQQASAKKLKMEKEQGLRPAIGSADFNQRRNETSLSLRTQSDVPKAMGKPMLVAANTPATVDWRYCTMLGLASGFILGFIGVGPAWMLAPIISQISPGGAASAGAPATTLPGTLGLPSPQGSSAESQKHSEVGGNEEVVVESVFGADERMRRTCLFAMVPPCLAAAWRHFQVGHVVNASTVAMPLALGAIAGSAIGGQQLDDVPCEEEFRVVLSLLLFVYGGWSVFRPGLS